MPATFQPVHQAHHRPNPTCPDLDDATESPLSVTRSTNISLPVMKRLSSDALNRQSHRSGRYPKAFCPIQVSSWAHQLRAKFRSAPFRRAVHAEHCIAHRGCHRTRQHNRAAEMYVKRFFYDRPYCGSRSPSRRWRTTLR